MSDTYEISVGGLVMAIRQSLLKILVISLIVTALVFAILWQLSPRYVSEARVLVSPSASLQNPAVDRAADQAQNFDQATIISQIQVIQSRDIIASMIDELKLMEDEKFIEFIRSETGGLLSGLLPFALPADFDNLPKAAQKEMTIDVIEDHMQVTSLSQSRVLGLRFYSHDRARAALIANGLAQSYISWQRSEKVLQNQDDSIRLARLIEDLKTEVKKSEAAVADYRASKGIFQSSQNDVTLGRQQLTELNSRIIAARERRAETEIRARLIRQMLEREGEVANAPEAMRSPSLQRLYEQKTRVQRSMAELNATLLPSHPRIRQLKSELRGINDQIRNEMLRVVSSMENDAIIAKAREEALVKSLNDLKNMSTRTDGDEIQLRALEREARTNRELLNTYLARFRDAKARKDSAIAPAYATIVSRAHVPTSAYFPKIGPMTLMAFLAALLIGFAVVTIRSILNGGAYLGKDRRRNDYMEPHPVFYEIDQK